MEPPLSRSFEGINFEKLTLVERRYEYEHVYTYLFKPENNINFIAGQYAHIMVPNVREGEKPVREISFASAPQDELLQFGIDARSGSGYQQALLAINPGDAVQLFKIKGHMTWPPPMNNVVMIAGGVGITPFRSMLRDVQHTQMQLTTAVVHVARAEHLYSDELSELTSHYFAITRTELQTTLNKITKNNSDAHYYVAGSSTFVVEIADMLEARGITQVERDVFNGLED